MHNKKDCTYVHIIIYFIVNPGVHLFNYQKVNHNFDENKINNVVKDFFMKSGIFFTGGGGGELGGGGGEGGGSEKSGSGQLSM